MRQLAVSRETQLPTVLGKLVFGWPEAMGRERKKIFVTFNLDRVCETRFRSSSSIGAATYLSSEIKPGKTTVIE
jgi:hypothetical protein